MSSPKVERLLWIVAAIAGSVYVAGIISRLA